jgi:hypothetical protein
MLRTLTMQTPNYFHPKPDFDIYILITFVSCEGFTLIIVITKWSVINPGQFP